MVQGENYVLFTRYAINIAKAAETTLCIIMCVHGLNTKNILPYERVCSTSLHDFEQNFKDHFCFKVRKLYDTFKWALVLISLQRTKLKTETHHSTKFKEKKCK